MFARLTSEAVRYLPEIYVRKSKINFNYFYQHSSVLEIKFKIEGNYVFLQGFVTLEQASRHDLPPQDHTPSLYCMLFVLHHTGSEINLSLEGPKAN